MDSGLLPDWVGARWRVLWSTRRSAGTEPGAQSDYCHLRAVYRFCFFRSDLVAFADFSFSVGAWHRWGVGGGVRAAFGELAETLGTLDCCGAANRRQYWCLASLCDDLLDGRPKSALGLPGGHLAGFFGFLDSAGRP